MRRIGSYAVLFVFIVALSPALTARSQSIVIPPADLNPPPWPEWVLKH